MTSDGDRARLEHIRGAIYRFLAWTAGGRVAFLENPMLQDAVIRNLEIIGEASKQLSSVVREQTPDVHWRLVSGMRDRLIHGYFGVDLDIVWEVVERRLPTLKLEVDRLLDG